MKRMRSSPRELTWRDRRALALAQAVGPDLLARFRIERDNRPAGARGRIQHALHHERRAFELELGERAEVVRLESPRDFELVEVRGVDLIERRVARPFQIGVVGGPLAAGGGWLTRLAGDAGGDADSREDRRHEGRHESRDCSPHRALPSGCELADYTPAAMARPASLPGN